MMHWALCKSYEEVFIRGCFCSTGLSAAILLNNKIKFADYVQVLNESLIL